MLGQRESEVYGSKSLDQIKDFTIKKISSNDVQLDWFQSNSETEIINKIHECIRKNYDGLVINPGAFTHTSVAIHDALKTFKNTVAEVHMSHVSSRESFRLTRLTSPAASLIIEGLGYLVYYIGIISILERINHGIPNNRS